MGRILNGVFLDYFEIPSPASVFYNSWNKVAEVFPAEWKDMESTLLKCSSLLETFDKFWDLLTHDRDFTAANPQEAQYI